jgi:hypothetical protein
MLNDNICVKASIAKAKKKVIKGVRGMPWLSETTKDVVSCEKSTGKCKRLLIHECPNGATHYVEDIVLRKERKPGELKHLSTRRNRKQLVIPQVVASERGKVQTTELRFCGVVGLT